jgi:hypothetical protein
MDYDRTEVLHGVDGNFPSTLLQGLTDIKPVYALDDRMRIVRVTGDDIECVISHPVWNGDKKCKLTVQVEGCDYFKIVNIHMDDRHQYQATHKMATNVIKHARAERASIKFIDRLAVKREKEKNEIKNKVLVKLKAYAVKFVEAWELNTYHDPECAVYAVVTDPNPSDDSPSVIVSTVDGEWLSVNGHTTIDNYEFVSRIHHTCFGE